MGICSRAIVLSCSMVALAFVNVMAKTAGPMQLGNVLSPHGKIKTDVAEIAAYMPSQKKLFVVGEGDVVEVLDMSNPRDLKKVESHKLAGDGSSVSAFENLVAVSSMAKPESDTGFVEIFSGSPLKRLVTLRPCRQPDMITFTPDGKKLVVACEGSPAPDFKEDPAGGIAIISLPEKSGKGMDMDFSKVKVNVLGFESLDSAALLNAGVRRVGTAPFYKTLEPEYVTVSRDSKVAWVSLQENNAIVKVDLGSEKITDVFALGAVDHSKAGFGLDVRKDKKIKIENWPLRGLRQPDGITSLVIDGRHYVITANEGSPVNDYDSWTDETTVEKLFDAGRLDSRVFDKKTLKALKDVKVSDFERCNENGREIPCPYAHVFGSRSMSIFDGSSGKLLWDSGDMLERAFAEIAPDYFNWNSKKGKVKVDARSEDKGCEPENVTTGVVKKPDGSERRYAFLGMERMSGVAVFDITEISAPKLVDYYLDPEDRGPEGMIFISAEDSPEPGTSLLVVGYEYSKTLVVYKVQ